MSGMSRSGTSRSWRQEFLRPEEIGRRVAIGRGQKVERREAAAPVVGHGIGRDETPGKGECQDLPIRPVGDVAADLDPKVPPALKQEGPRDGQGVVLFARLPFAHGHDLFPHLIIEARQFTIDPDDHVQKDHVEGGSLIAAMRITRDGHLKGLPGERHAVPRQAQKLVRIVGPGVHVNFGQTANNRKHCHTHTSRFFRIGPVQGQPLGLRGIKMSRPQGQDVEGDPFCQDRPLNGNLGGLDLLRQVEDIHTLA